MHSIVRKDAGASPLTIEDLVRVYRELQAVRWPLFPPRSRKLQPYIREAWRRAVLLLCLLLALALGACQVGPPTAEQRAATATVPTGAPPTAVLPTENPKTIIDEFKAVTAINQQVTEFVDALLQVSKLVDNPKFTYSWKVNLAVQAVRMHRSYQSLLDLDVPPKIKALRVELLGAMIDCNASADKLISGIDTNNPKDVQEATRLIQACGVKLEKANLEIDKISP